MLRQLSNDVKYCYQRAHECHEAALSAQSFAVKDSLIAAEEGWIVLAHSYELTETLSDFVAKARQTLR